MTTDFPSGLAFDEVDRSCAERLAAFAEVALRNARHLRDVERRALQDPATGAHRLELLHDVVQREIERAARFGRSFSVAKLKAMPGGEALSQPTAARDALVASLRSRLRAADLLALASDGTVLVLAGTHFLVDGYGNVLTPLLPLLITDLNLSLAGAGALQMCFQLANSVSQLGFGHLADRWRPRLLLIAGPIVAASVLPFVGHAANVWTLAAILIVGGLGGAAFHPPAAAVVHHVGGSRRGLAAPRCPRRWQ